MAKKTTKPTNGSHQPTTAAEWRKPREEGVLVPLPSGNWARLFPTDLMKMVKAGQIPDELSPIAAQSVWMEQDPEKIGQDFSLAEKYDELMDIVIPAIFAEPKVALPGEKPGEDEISIEDIDLTDRTAAFNLAIMGASSMRKFREQQEERMAALSNGDEAGNKAK